MTDAPRDDMTITEYELEQCRRANETGRQPVVFVHGLWLLPSSWDRWGKLFEDNGYVALSPGWPDDPETVEEAAEHPEVFAGKSIGQVADHFATIIGGLDHKPAIIGHSTGGLLTRSWPGGAWPRCRWRSTRPPSGGCCRCPSRPSSRAHRCCATRPTATGRCR